MLAIFAARILRREAFKFVIARRPQADVAISQYPAGSWGSCRRKRNCLPEIATGAKRPRNDKPLAFTILTIACLLCRFLQGFYGKPRVDLALLRQHSEGLIALSACLAGEIPRRLRAGDYDGAKAYALELSGIFGPEHFYLELQDHGIPEQREVNRGLLRIAQETGLPLVATNDAHYLTREDSELQDVLLCIQTGKTLDDPNRMRFETQEFYLKSEDEMRALFPALPEALENTQRIADRCKVEFEFNHYHLPARPVAAARRKHIKK